MQLAESGEKRPLEKLPYAMVIIDEHEFPQKTAKGKKDSSDLKLHRIPCSCDWFFKKLG